MAVELKDFIKATLLDIVSAIEETQRKRIVINYKIQIYE